MNLFDVKGKIVVITGCSGNLGLEYVSNFIKNGSIVIGLDVTINEFVTSLLLDFPQQFFFYKVDITKKAQIVDCLKDIILNIGTPNVLINNAAIDFPPTSSINGNGRFEDCDENSWKNVLDVNINGTFLVTQVFGSEMAKSKNGGSIVNISSIYGIVSPDQSIYDYKRKNGEIFYKPASYSVSKSALINFTKYLAVYWAESKIRVNTLVIAGVFNNQDDEFLEAYTKRIPIGRMANVNEYNGALVFLASDASKYMTGSELVIDGGWTAI
jgi:NAD(P)-dependent dehydrogenase (short-subunit alcohol dehydrogenase family)